MCKLRLEFQQLISPLQERSEPLQTQQFVFDIWSMETTPCPLFLREIVQDSGLWVV